MKDKYIILSRIKVDPGQELKPWDVSYAYTIKGNAGNRGLLDTLYRWGVKNDPTREFMIVTPIFVSGDIQY